ncbi:MAG TPA: thiamine diphosphokinase [Ruminococcaceae bacterium]|nr:thiamine diphosphokinase [Oscillospiraceae bacterium]
MRCVIIAASPDADINFIKSAVSPDDFVICADRGYHYAKLAGIKPDLIIGDFDSYSGILPQDVEIMRLNVRKDDSDAFVCARQALKRGFNEIAVLGGMGGRLDHSYANLCLLEYLAGKGVRASLISQDEKIFLLQKGAYFFDGYDGKTFSLFPFGCSSARASVQNAEYPVNGFVFESKKSTGLSNIFRDGCKISVSSGKLLLIINLADV